VSPVFKKQQKGEDDQEDLSNDNGVHLMTHDERAKIIDVTTNYILII
jgi:hypothetical protein